MQTVFFSYARRDHEEELQQAARQLSERLAAIGLTDAVFLDVAMKAGDAWRDTIESAMKQATVFVAVLEPAYWRSPHCRHEVVQALERAREDPRFRIIPVRFNPIDSADLDIDARQLYDELMERQARSAQAGFTLQVVDDLAEQVVRFGQEEQADESPEGRSGRVVRDLRKLLCMLLNTDSLEPVLFSIPKLRDALLHIPAHGSFEYRMQCLASFVVGKPEFALALMYHLKRNHPGIEEIDGVLEDVRELDSMSGVRKGNPLSDLFDILLNTGPDVVVSCVKEDLDDGWNFLKTLAEKQGSPWSQLTQVLRVLSSRTCLTLELLDAIRVRMPVVAAALADLEDRLPIPDRRLRLIELMADLFLGGPQLLQWWLQCDLNLSKWLSRIRFDLVPYRVFRDLVERCDVRGELDETFFSRLVVFSPQRFPDIRYVAGLWGLDRLDWRKRFWRERLTLLLAEVGDEIEHLIGLAYDIPPGELMDADDGVPLLLRLDNLLRVAERRGCFNRSIYGLVEAHFPDQAQKLREIELIMLREESRADLLSKPPVISTQIQQQGQRADLLDELREAAARLQSMVHAGATSARWHKDMREILASSWTSGTLRLVASDIGIPRERLPASPVSREHLADGLVKEALLQGLDVRLVDLLCEKLAEQ